MPEPLRMPLHFFIDHEEGVSSVPCLQAASLGVVIIFCFVDGPAGVFSCLLGCMLGALCLRAGSVVHQVEVNLTPEWRMSFPFHAG